MVWIWERKQIAKKCILSLSMTFVSVGRIHGCCIAKLLGLLSGLQQHTLALLCCCFVGWLFFSSNVAYIVQGGWRKTAIVPMPLKVICGSPMTKMCNICILLGEKMQKNAPKNHICFGSKCPQKPSGGPVTKICILGRAKNAPNCPPKLSKTPKPNPQCLHFWGVGGVGAKTAKKNLQICFPSKWPKKSFRGLQSPEFVF